MELLDGFTLEELTEDRIVQSRPMGETGKVTFIGNPHPDPERQRALFEDVALYLRQCRRLNEIRNKERSGQP